MRRLVPQVLLLHPEWVLGTSEVGKEFSYVIMLILPIIFICNPLHSFSAVWLEQFRLIEDFSHYFLFLSLPLASSHGASPKICLPYVGNFTERLLWKVCVCVRLCVCVCVCVRERERERARDHLCVFGRGFHPNAKVNGLLFPAGLSADPIWFPQLSLRCVSPHL